MASSASHSAAARPRWHRGLTAAVAAAPLLLASGLEAAAACAADAIVVPVGMLIQAAVDAAPPRAKFCIKAGIHRLQSIVPKPGQQFVGETGAVLNGSRILYSFRREGQFWVADEQRQRGGLHGKCLRGREACVDSAGLYIDGRPLIQVAEKGDLESGRFLFDHGNDRILLADDPTGKLVEVAAAQYAFSGSSPNVVVRNLVIEKYYNPPQTGAVHGALARGWTVEDCDFRFNSGAGVSIGSDGVLRRSAVHQNGQLGVAGMGTNLLLEHNDIWGNNTAGFDPDWEAGGVKISHGIAVTFRGNRSYRNAGPGLWCDIDCRDVTFQQNTVEHNDGPGIFFEISAHASIKDNVLYLNGQARPPWFWGAEIQIAGSRDVDIAGNKIMVRPDGRSIMLIDQNRDKEGGGTYETRNNQVHDNDIVYLGGGAGGGVTDAPAGSRASTIIERGGNRFDANRYRYAAAAPQFIWGQAPLDFAGFRRLGQEKDGSLVAAPALPN